MLADGRNTVVFRDLRAEPAAAAPGSTPAGPISDPAWPGGRGSARRPIRPRRRLRPRPSVAVGGSSSAPGAGGAAAAAPATGNPATPPPATGRWFSQVG